MKFNNKNLEFFAYTSIIILLFIIMCSLVGRNRIPNNNNLKFRDMINKNSNIEGFTNDKAKTKLQPEKIDHDSLLELIDNKLKYLIMDLGNQKDIEKTRQILKKTKKISDIESSKCIMGILDNNRDNKDFSIENILHNDYDEKCVKYRKYTELSQSIQSIINNL
jgi:hypothetical protein